MKRLIFLLIISLFLVNGCAGEAARTTNETKEAPSKPIFLEGIKFNSMPLKLEYFEEKDGRFIYEYINLDRSLDDWCNMVAVRNYKDISPKEALDIHLENYLKNKPEEARYETYSNPDKGYIWDFITWEENPEENDGVIFVELNMWLFYTTKAGETRSIQYATRYYGNEMDIVDWTSSEEFSDQWVELRDTHINELTRISEGMFGF